MDKSTENAYILIAGVRAALINGVRHYNSEGKFLSTGKEILDTLVNEGEIIFDVRDKVQRTTDEEQLEIVKKEFVNV